MLTQPPFRHSKKKKQKKNKKDKKAKRAAGSDDDSDEGGSGVAAPILMVGTGRLLSSETTISGVDGTKFMEELSVGDAVIVQDPNTFKHETRIVKMVLSNVSISISSSFPSNFISGQSFTYMKAPKQTAKKDEKESSRKRKHEAEEKSAFGTYAGGGTVGETVTYRVKKAGAYGGYEIVTETATEGKSREELLDMRCSKKGDRICF